MAEFPALPLWTDAYLADTGHLSVTEHGMYFLMLVQLWRAPKQRLPNDDAWLGRKFGRSVEVFVSEWKPIMQEFMQTDGNWWTQKRLSAEFAYVQQLSAKRSDAAKSMWEKKKASCISISPAYAPTPTPTPIKKDTLSAVPADFEAFWQSYPLEKNMSKKRTLMAWKKLSPEERVQAAGAVPGYRRYCDKEKNWYHAVHAERFLSQERFKGFAPEFQPTTEEIEIARDRADRLMRRGKYAVDYT